MIVSPRLFWSGIILGFIGCLFYANFREPVILFDSLPLFHLFTLVEQPILLPNAISEWIPSFLHVLGMSLFTAGIIGVTKKTVWQIPVAWLAIDLIFESLQFFQTHNILTWGNFEWVDVIAMTVSAIISILILEQAHQKQQPKLHRHNSPIAKILAKSTIFGVGAFMMLGSYLPYGPYDEHNDYRCVFPDGQYYDECGVDPIYISWEKIRESGKLLSAEYGADYQQPLTNSNKIYTYHHLLLINEKQLGVHIFDNTDPENPLYLDFISLIGNQDMAIKDQYLYLDSFTDLVVYDLTDINKAPARKQNVFNFSNSTEALPFNLYYNNYPKASRGVVIGYSNVIGKKFYFWSDFAGLED